MSAGKIVEKFQIVECRIIRYSYLKCIVANSHGDALQHLRPRLRHIWSLIHDVEEMLFVIPVAALVVPLVAQKSGTAQKPRLSFMDANAISYIRPGIVAKVVSAAIAKDGTITARVKISDPKGVPLDMDGINTAGPVTLRFIAAYIPAGQKQYVTYTTTVAEGDVEQQPIADPGGCGQRRNVREERGRRLHLHV